MIDKILPGEIRRHDEEFAERNENKRRVLRTTQANDVARLEEKLKALTWKNMQPVFLSSLDNRESMLMF